MSQSVTTTVASTTSRRRRGFLTRLTIIATLGGLLFGYDTGVISGALLYMRTDLGLSTGQEAFVVSSLLFPGAAFGAILGGRISDGLGRRKSLLLCALLFLVGALGCAFAPGVVFLVVFRVILGFGVGAAAVSCPVYLSEMAPSERRGRMVTINELMIVIGQLLAFSINAVLAAIITDPHVWRVMLAVAAVPALALLIGMFTLPESPRWTGARGRRDEALRVLELSRAPEEAATELADITTTAEVEGNSRSHAWKALRDNPWMRRLLWIGMGLAAAQQASGVFTANYYAPTILTSNGFGHEAALIATAAIGLIGVLATILGIWLLGFVGRRRMLIIGFCGVVGSHAFLAVVFALPKSSFTSYITIAALMIFVGFVQAFLGTTVWLFLSEVFPLGIRGLAMGFVVFVLWTVNAIISYLFPIVIAAVGPTPTYIGLLVINLVSLTFVLRTIPETKGRSLETLERDFRTEAIRTVNRRERLAGR